MDVLIPGASNQRMDVGQANGHACVRNYAFDLSSRPDGLPDKATSSFQSGFGTSNYGPRSQSRCDIRVSTQVVQRGRGDLNEIPQVMNDAGGRHLQGQTILGKILPGGKYTFIYFCTRHCIPPFARSTVLALRSAHTVAPVMVEGSLTGCQKH